MKKAIFLSSLTLILINFFSLSSQGAKKQPLTPQVKQVLAMTDFAIPLRGKNPEFFVRGVIQSIQAIGQGQYQVSLLPIEVLKNPQHYINPERFAQGLSVNIRIIPKAKKNLEKGNIIELNQYYIIHEEGKGAARLVALEFKQEVKAYPASSAAYVKKEGLNSMQTINALLGLTYSSDPKLSQDEELKKSIQNYKNSKDKALSMAASKVNF